MIRNRTHRVLLVEDDAAVRSMVAGHLSKQRYEVKSVESAEAVLDVTALGLRTRIGAVGGVIVVFGLLGHQILDYLHVSIPALMIAGGLLLLALITGLIARQRIKQINLVPERTVESVKGDLEWARSQMQSNAR